MRITCSKNPFNIFSCWFENEILTPISRYYYTHKKDHYQCCVCGMIVSPYFDDMGKCSPTLDMGWHKFNEGKWSRFVCHHCADHGFAPSSYNGTERVFRDYTWDEWQDHVKENNDNVLAIIKKKDPEYYHYWFEGGREQELFGDDEEYDEQG